MFSSFFLSCRQAYADAEDDPAALKSINETTEEGESLLSLACSGGYFELAQVRPDNLTGLDYGDLL